MKIIVATLMKIIVAELMQIISKCQIGIDSYLLDTSSRAVTVLTNSHQQK